MRFDIITIFPELIRSYFSQTILARAQKQKLIDIRVHDLRRYARKGDPHKSVDDRPYGGGPGMILKIEPIFKAFRALRIFFSRPTVTLSTGGRGGGMRGRLKKSRIIMLTPSGKRFTQRDAERLSKYKRLVLLCGRYEGFDARVEKLVDEKISIGDFMLAGGELPAMMIVEAVSRHIPGVVGHPDALKEETFSKHLEYKEYPQYTRPAVFYPESTKKQRNRETEKQVAGLPSRSTPPTTVGGKGEGWRAPKILLSGNHKKIQKWREEKAR